MGSLHLEYNYNSSATPGSGLVTRRFNPERALGAAATVASGAGGITTEATRDNPVVFAMDITIPASPSGILMELGGASNGAGIGFDSSGDLGFTQANNQAAEVTGKILSTDSFRFPSGTGTLVLEFGDETRSLGTFGGSSKATIRLWWNGRKIADISGANANLAAMSGGAAGSYGTTDATAPDSAVIGSGATNCTLNSDLRIYDNKLVT